VLPHLAVLRRASRIFQLRASAELALDRTDQAWADTRMALYLADTLKNEPFLVCKLVQVAIVQLALSPIWEGLAEHKWSDAQLTEIEQRLGKLDLLSGAALRGNRAFDILTFDQMRLLGKLDPMDYSGRLTGLPNFLLGGFFYQNQLFLARLYQQHLVPVVDAANQRLYPSRGFANDTALTNAMAGGFKPYRVVARLLLGGLVSAQATFGFGQTRVNETIVACALERYRLAQGQYPESLEDLSPRFLQKLPHDLITGAPLKYRRLGDGQFILYSVGWNEKDDGGQVVQPKAEETASEVTEGDWVWQYPAPAEKAAKQ
jgi:hypothetical protein